jgi:RimJ/RimL family protein N-acetyltransferase
MADISYRFLNVDDFDDMHAMVSHWSVVRQLGRWPWPPEPAFTRSRCRPYRGHGFVWAVVQNDRVLGTVAVTGGELGYMYHPDAHGQGIGTKAATDAINAAFADDDWPMLVASVWEDNAGSAALLRKCGFVHWQTHYIRSRARGAPTLVHQYRLPRSVWDDLRHRAE